MTTARATRFNLLKMGLCDDLCGQANHSINPSPKSIDYMRQDWLQKEHGGLNDLSMMDSIKNYAKDNSNRSGNMRRLIFNSSGDTIYETSP